MKYLITGGTGSLGHALTKRLKDVVIYSRDEYKQRKMLTEFPKAKFIVGDVRDLPRLTEACRGVDRVIHAAALKHVPVGEEDPEEVVKTNILGTLNVIKACKVNGVKKVVYVSTDKACYPINLYGMTKAVSEKLFIQANVDSKTTFACVRYGNVIGSRGSVIEYIKEHHPKVLNITDKRMSRFWLTLDQAVDLVILAFTKGKKGEIIVPKARHNMLVDTFKELNPKMKLVETGMRPGEKLAECLVGRDESRHTDIHQKYFVIKPELFGVKYGKEFEYTSD